MPADGDCFFHAALFLTNTRHIGSIGLLNRACLRARMADWLIKRTGDEGWQLAANRTGEVGLALDVAKAEAARDEAARARASVAVVKEECGVVGRSPVVAGADDDVDADGLPPVLVDDSSDQELDDLIEEEVCEDLDALTLDTLVAYIGGNSE